MCVFVCIPLVNEQLDPEIPITSSSSHRTSSVFISFEPTAAWNRKTTQKLTSTKSAKQQNRGTFRGTHVAHVARASHRRHLLGIPCAHHRRHGTHHGGKGHQGYQGHHDTWLWPWPQKMVIRGSEKSGKKII